ncbi:MAG TPA: hypothetical protein DER64_12170, partial [Planctomycetaceae bacterium]|nr:hypothetical protein [Planctomycetaceae bacterium]
ATVLKHFQPLMYFVRDRRAVETTCRVTWDNRFLYLAFDCLEPRIAELPRSSAQRQRNRNTLVLSKSPRAANFIRIDIPLDSSPSVLARKSGVREWAKDTTVGSQPARAHRTTARGWTAEWRVPWGLLGGAPRTGDTRRATVTRVRSPWAEHDSWAPQIDPNLIDDKLLGTWVFGARSSD